MQHDPDFTLAHPVIPFAACPAHIRELLGLLASDKREIATRDGRLTCSCGNTTGCTCKPTTDAAPVPAKPRISKAVAIGVVLALKHLDARLQVLEQHQASGDQSQFPDLAAAEAKAAALRAQIRIDKIEQLAAAYAEKRNPTPDEPLADPKDQQPEDDRAKYGAGQFDPSCGNQSQKTPRHPVGDSEFVQVPSKAQYNLMKHEHDARENRAFRDNERAHIKDIKSKIEESNRKRWN